MNRELFNSRIDWPDCWIAHFFNHNSDSILQIQKMKPTILLLLTAICCHAQTNWFTFGLSTNAPLFDDHPNTLTICYYTDDGDIRLEPWGTNFNRCTNIVVPDDYRGTLQIGSNYLTMDGAKMMAMLEYASKQPMPTNIWQSFNMTNSTMLCSVSSNVTLTSSVPISENLRAAIIKAPNMLNNYLSTIKVRKDTDGTFEVGFCWPRLQGDEFKSKDDWRGFKTDLDAEVTRTNVSADLVNLNYMGHDDF